MILNDLSHAVFRTLMMNKDQVRENYNFLTHLIISQILSFSNKLGASKQNQLVIAMDSPNTWRKKYYEQNKVKFPEMREMTYKGNRTKDDTLNWELIYEKIDKVGDVLKANSDFYVMKVAEAEADDIIAVLANEYKHREHIWIAASDKDFIQLQDETVHIFDPLKQAFKPEQNVELFKKIHTIIGDKSDNIPAIKPRVQEKTALKMIKDLDILLKTNPEMREHYEFNQNLILFDYIPNEIKTSILMEYQNQNHSYNGMKLLSEFTKLGLTKHCEDINRFKLSEQPVKTKLNQFYIELEKANLNADRSLEEFFS